MCTVLSACCCRVACALSVVRPGYLHISACVLSWPVPLLCCVLLPCRMRCLTWQRRSWQMASSCWSLVRVLLLFGIAMLNRPFKRSAYVPYHHLSLSGGAMATLILLPHFTAAVAVTDKQPSLQPSTRHPQLSPASFHKLHMSICHAAWPMPEHTSTCNMLSVT